MNALGNHNEHSCLFCQKVISLPVVLGVICPDCLRVKEEEQKKNNERMVFRFKQWLRRLRVGNVENLR